MLHTARLLLTNKQGGTLAQMCITPDLPAMCKTLGSIVVHTVAVLDSNSRHHSLLPFVNMMTNPAQLAVSYHFCIGNSKICFLCKLSFLECLFTNYARR